MRSEELARRAHGLLKELLDLDAAEQRRRLDECCAGEPRLRAEVESLLAASESANGFLEAPALDGELGQLDSEGFVGRQVGNYLLEERLGIGGMGTVFRARELDPARQVALKLMNPGTVDQGALRRFQTEIHILAQLDHPGIARLYASGSWDAGFGGVPWYTMEWIQGGRRLTDYAREEDLDLDRRLELFGQVCEAVEHGHRCGVIHRDLKPSNLLVDADGRPRVIDFGVATFLDPEHQTAHRTTFAGIVGTVGYMSPEQLQEGGGLADVCSDVYALGVVLYELLTESHPHDLRETSLVQAIRVVREGTPRRPSMLRPELRGDLEAIVLKAMDRDRDRRYLTVAELRADVERYRRREPVLASPPSRLREARYLARRHRTWVVSGLMTFAVLLVATVVSSVLALRLSDEVERRKDAQAEVERERDAQARNAYRANVMAAEGFWRAGEMVSMRARLAQTLPEHRDWEWHFLQRLSQPADWVMSAHAGRVRDVELSHDGRRVASTDQYGWLVVSVPGTEEARSLRVFEGEASAVAWSSTDRTLAVSSGRGELALVDVRAWHVERYVTAHRGHVSVLLLAGTDRLVSAAWDGTVCLTDTRSGEVEVLAEAMGRPRHGALSHGGTLLALVDSEAGIVLFDLSTKTERARWQHAEPLSVAFAHDDASLWIGTLGGAVEHVALDGGTRRKVAVHSQDVRHLSPHPTADLLLSTGGDHAAAVLRVPELEVLARYRGHEETIQAADWSPDGETLVTSSWDGTVQSISLARLEDPGSLRGHEGQVHALAFAPDGRHLASGAVDGRLVLWDFEKRTEVWSTEEHESSVRAVSFRADGEVLASGGIDGRVRTWRVTNGALLSTLKPGVGRIYAVDYLADGRLAVAGQSGVIELYDAGLERLAASWPGHDAAIRDLDVDPLRPQLASASMDGTVRLWSLADGSSRVLRAHTDGVYRVSFGAAGTLASGGRDQRLCLWDGETGELLHENRTHGQFVTAIAWRSDGNRLATGSWFETLKVWEPDPLQELLTIHDDPTPVREACFSPDGRWLLSGSGDGRIRILDGRP